MNARFACLVSLAIVHVACASVAPPTEPAEAAPPRAAAPLMNARAAAAPVPADPAPAEVGTYVSIPWGFETSSYWLEGPAGLVLIDTQFLPSAAVEAVDRAEAATGKKVLAAIVLHPNPDKFNGTAVLQERGIRVLTSAQVAELVPRVHTKRVEWFYDRYQPDYPRDAPELESLGDSTKVIELAGLELEIHVLGKGCSDAHVVVEHAGHVFVGDLVASDNHAWLELGHTEEWLDRLEEIQALAPRFVHPGRGPSGGPELLGSQRRYLERVIELVKAAQPKGEPDEAKIASIKQTLVEEHPLYGYDVFLRLGLPAVWRRYAADAP
jgi:glyoxylase-like metal-dependent hydrolase (beta-lactamase superfamily II)